MDRRQALKTMGAAALAQLSTNELFAMARETHSQLQDITDTDRYIFKSLDPRQNEMVTMMAELIIPETDTPGAKAARVNEFIDVMLTDWFTDEERSSFRKGLAELDGDETPFVEHDPAEQVVLLERAEEAALAEQEERATSRSPVATSDSPAAQPFFSVMKWLTLWGYYTSEIGMEQELGHVVFRGSYEGCAPIHNVGRNIEV